MTALYALAEQYRQAAAKLADIDLPPEVVADTLESIGGDLEIKAQNVAMMARSLYADAAAMKEWADQAAERAKATKARADHLRDYLARCLESAGVKKIEGPGVTIGWRASSAVVIDQVELIPAEYMRQRPPPAPEPDKTAIADAIKSGADVSGAHIEQRKHLLIK